MQHVAYKEMPQLFAAVATGEVQSRETFGAKHGLEVDPHSGVRCFLLDGKLHVISGNKSFVFDGKRFHNERELGLVG